MHFNQLANDGESQASPGRGEDERMFATEETFKDASLIFKRDAYTVILHIHLHVTVLLVDINVDGSIFGRIVEGIIHEIAHDLPYAFSIAHYRRYLWLRLQ